MDIIISIHSVWANMILNKEKPFEFRTKLPNHISIGDTIYMYETAKHNGARAIVGKCKIENIVNILSDKGEWPTFGAYPFIEYYCSNIINDTIAAATYESVKKEFENKFKNYKYGYIIDFAFSPRELDHIRKHGKPINLWDSSFEFVQQIIEEKDKSAKYIKDCDAWLRKIGYYNDFDESYYKYAFLLTDIEKFDKPIPISDFLDKNNNAIQRAPQSWMYTNGPKGS